MTLNLGKTVELVIVKFWDDIKTARISFNLQFHALKLVQ